MSNDGRPLEPCGTARRPASCRLGPSTCHRAFYVRARLRDQGRKPRQADARRRIIPTGKSKTKVHSYFSWKPGKESPIVRLFPLTHKDLISNELVFSAGRVGIKTLAGFIKTGHDHVMINGQR